MKVNHKMLGLHLNNDPDIESKNNGKTKKSLISY